MKFLDLNTGYSFDGLWKTDQSTGYVFWLPNEQSVNITYSMPICILTNEPEPLKLTIEDNNVFSFISRSDKMVEVDCCSFYEPIITSKDPIMTTPEDLGNNWYAHVFNVAGLSENAGEFICKIFIGDNGDYIKVGGDFYGIYEPTLINLSNFGVEISTEIQRAFYQTNIHNDEIDNILINRKFKELLSNYWDIVANRGSYKSLVNSLNWFEWDDNLKIKTMQKREEGPITLFDDKDIIGSFRNRLEDTYKNFIKTAYVSLFYSLYSDSNEYDSEGNPVLIENVMKWARNDMQIKLALLTQFFGAYFLPIHMSVLYSALEYQVYTNTTKAISCNNTTRHDAFGDFTFVESNVKTNDVFKISNVSAFVRKNTKFGYYDPERPQLRFGVDEFPDRGKIDIEKFAKHYYTGPGVIIPINLVIPNQDKNDFIKHTIVYLNDERMDFYNRINVKDGKINIDFNFLATSAMEYEMKFVFIFGSSKTISHVLRFNVEDVDNLNLNVYKICAKDDSKPFTYEDYNNFDNYKYIFKIQARSSEDTNSCYMQYLPVMLPDNSNYENYNGIKLNRTVVFDVNNLSTYDISILEHYFKDYLAFKRYKDDKLTYITFVSNTFFADIPEHLNIHPEYKPIRNDLGFYPQFHDFVKMDGDNESDYTISQYDAICCAAEINIDKRHTIPFRYGNKIESSEWSFIHSVTGEVINHPASSVKPFVASPIGQLKPGYYGISFKYRLGENDNECRRESAFRIKVI
jgi:hypothetical protein